MPPPSVVPPGLRCFQRPEIDLCCDCIGSMAIPLLCSNMQVKSMLCSNFVVSNLQLFVLNSNDIYPFIFMHLQLLMIEIFKTKNNLNQTFMKNIFTERNIQDSLRSENHLRLPKVKTTTYIENFQYRGCHLWSSLPRETKDSDTLAEFKRKIKSCDGNTCICRLCKVFIKDLGFCRFI